MCPKKRLFAVHVVKKITDQFSEGQKASSAAELLAALILLCEEYVSNPEGFFLFF